MKNFAIPTFIILTLITFVSLITVTDKPNSGMTLSNTEFSTAYQAQLGKQLFHDKRLSKDGTQACSSCHNPEHGFIDNRDNQTSHPLMHPAAVSLGQDNQSLGDINAPTIAYSAFVPSFHFDKEEKLYKGGLFANGRASNLTEQAKGPFLNPVEMQSSQQHVIDTIKKHYPNALQLIYGENIYNDTDFAFTSIAESIAAFEKSKEVSPFDSKFDRVLKGEASFSAQEQRGLDLFKDEKKGNCAACHPVPTTQSTPAESLFTDFSYDNLGVPANKVVRVANGKAANYQDLGLYDNPEVSNPEFKGAFRVSTLRNIAVTAPYMHNGIFNNLETVVHFYNSRDVKGATNPETNQPWQTAEVNQTKNTDELGNLMLSDAEIVDIVAFLKTLTDARYEYLLNAAVKR